MAALLYSVLIILYASPTIVSINITLFNTPVWFSGNNSCFLDTIDRGCECDQFCVKHQECCIDYEIWLESSSPGSMNDTIIDNDVITNWKIFIEAVISDKESTLDVNSFKSTFQEIEKLIISRKEKLVEFACNANVLDLENCDNTYCDMFKILTIEKCDSLFEGDTNCGYGNYNLVYDTRTDLVYRDRECAICNFVKPEYIVPFVKMVVLHEDILSDEDLKNKTPKAMEKIEGFPRYEILSPKFKTYSRCQPKVYACEVESSDSLTKACLAYRGFVNCYANPHCEKCAEKLDPYYDERCNVHYFGSRIAKPTFAIFIDTTGGLTRVYPTETSSDIDVVDENDVEHDKDTADNADDVYDDVVSTTSNVALKDYSTKEAVTPSAQSYDEPSKYVTAVYNDILYVITLTGSIISIFSIILALLTLYIFPGMRNTSGWINILLLLTILISCILYLFLLIDKEIPSACRAIAIAKHFTMISTFCWINCLGFNIFLSTKPKPIFSKQLQKKLFICYCMYSYCIPTLIVGSCVAIEYLSKEEAVIYEYWDCFLTWNAKLVAFIVPISVMMLLNKILFVIIIINVKRKSQVSQEQSSMSRKKRQKFEFILGLKIFCAFALYWIFGIIATLIVTIKEETTAFSLILNLIFVLTASMQGVFVCFAVVFNKRVMNMWKRKIFGAKQKKQLEKEKLDK